MTHLEQVKLLTFLGHLQGPIATDADAATVTPEVYAIAVRRFQKHVGLDVDGIVGPKTDAKMAALAAVRPPGVPGTAPLYRLAPWRMTSYYIVEQTSSGNVPMIDSKGRLISKVPSAFFSSAALEGTAKLMGGTLVNVDGGFVPALDPDEYISVLAWYKGYQRSMIQKRRQPKPPGYFGILTNDDETRVLKVKPFKVVPREEVGMGYGIEKLGIPKEPFRTLAADLGTMALSEPTWKGKGGLAGPGTRVWILEAVGKPIPGTSSYHDGWFTVNDCGGGIFGAHFDEFVGTPSIAVKSPICERAHVWWAGMEDKVPVGYSYGLYDT